MATAKNRELITVTKQAHKHLRDVVNRLKKNGIPANGTLLASQQILSIPLPELVEEKPTKRRARKAALPVSTQAAVSVPAA